MYGGENVVVVAGDRVDCRLACILRLIVAIANGKAAPKGLEIVLEDDAFEPRAEVHGTAMEVTVDRIITRLYDDRPPPGGALKATVVILGPLGHAVGTAQDSVLHRFSMKMLPQNEREARKPPRLSLPADDGEFRHDFGRRKHPCDA